MLDAIKRYYPELTPKTVFIISLVFLYPAAAATVPHAGGLVLIPLILAGLFTSLGFRKALHVWEKRVFLAFLLFFVYSATTLLYTENLATGLQRLDRIAQFSFAFFAYLYLRQSKLDLLPAFMGGLILGGVVLFVTAVIDLFVLGKVRASGHSYAIFFGDFCVLISFLLLAWILYNRQLSGWKLSITMLSGVAAMSAAFMSGTKGGLVYIPVGLLVVLLLMRSILDKAALVRLSIFFIGSVLLVSIMNAAGAGAMDRVKQDASALAGDGAVSSSTRVRIQMWEVAFRTWQAHPLLGVGLGDYRLALVDAFDDMGKQAPRYTHAHSNILNFLAETGLIGTALFIVASLLPAAAVMLLSASSELQLYQVVVVLIVTAMFVFGLTETWYSRNTFLRADIIFSIVAMSLYFNHRQQTNCN
jgi:O-antigen ligase